MKHLLKFSFFLFFVSIPIFSFAQKRAQWAIAIHGGAGSTPKNLSKEKIIAYKAELIKARVIGQRMLAEGMSAIDVVEAVVVFLENNPMFNAGKGSVTNNEGFHELDAAIMDGSSLEAGAIAGVRDVKNPIKAARLVMDSTVHVLLIGDGASAFAHEMKLDIVDNRFFSLLKVDEPHSDKGTVGCVALDVQGNLAAATSTGGMRGKKWGRVGDVPIIGAGTYANNLVAISGTGHGELWIRRVVAHDIATLMEYKSVSLEEAAHEVIFNKISSMGGFGGGVIAVDKDGNISLVFNTTLMYRAWAKSSGEQGVKVLK